MSDQAWHYTDTNKQQQGPISFAQLQELAQSNALSRDALVWTQGMNAWSPAHTVNDLFSGTASTAGNIYAAPQSTPMGHPDAAAYDPSMVTYAGFWKRFLSYIIDYIAMAIVGFIVGLVIGIVFALAGVDSETTTVIAQLAGFALSWLYHAFMESSATQGTLGKMALGVKVVDYNGERISFARATGRFFAKILSFIIIFIGCIMAAFTDRKQGLHDMIAGTLVVNKH